MTGDHSGCRLDRLAPVVAAYTSEPFRLLEDLDHLDKVRRVGAPEATILYCARILETLAADALRAVQLPPSANVCANFETLQQYNLIPTAIRCWAHTLRRTGNLVRHIRRRVQPEDMEVGILLVERWLEWFFRAFRYGHRLSSLTRDGQPLGLSAAAELRALLEALEDLDRNLESILREANAGFGSAILQATALSAVLAEMLLDRSEYTAVRTVLDAALAKFPDELQLCQLQGLYWSRTGNLTEALRCLGPLNERYKEDDETAGITAGVYKRLWLQNKLDTALQDKSQRAYRQGWERSRRSNVYLGVNAATTALWQGRTAKRDRLGKKCGSSYKRGLPL
jgi:hypothetical protein